MNPLQKPLQERTREEIDREIERMARKQGVKPFDPDMPFEGEFFDSDEEFEEFLGWLRENRRDNPNRSKID